MGERRHKGSDSRDGRDSLRTGVDACCGVGSDRSAASGTPEVSLYIADNDAAMSRVSWHVVVGSLGCHEGPSPAEDERALADSMFGAMLAACPAGLEVPPAMIDAVLFDFDGLILDTESTLRRAWEEIYQSHGLSVPGAVWASWVGSSADPVEAYEYLERNLEQPIDRSALRDRRMAREHELLKREQVMAGVVELIDDAVDRELRLAIASSSDHEWVAGHLRRLGLFDRFDAIVTADDVVATKPAPDLYRVALDRLGVSAERAIAFEDSAHGVAAAAAAGLFCIAVPNRVTRHASFPGANLIVETLAGRPLAEFLRAAESAARGY